MKIKIPSTCLTCGYIWEKGQNGSHSCSHTFQLKMTKIEEKLKECRKRNPLSKSLKELDIIVNGDLGQLKSVRERRNEL